MRPASPERLAAVLAAPRLGLAAFSRRLLLRGVFLLLALATLAFAVLLLQDEKARGHRSYAQDFRKTQAEVMARLRHPAGQLALLNPDAGEAMVPMRPLVLPYPALDFDDPSRVQQAVDQAGCGVRWPDEGTLCVAVGAHAFAGGYLYLVGSFLAGDLASREPGAAAETAHRARIRLELRGELFAWLAPFERVSLLGEPLVRGRLVAYPLGSDGTIAAGARAVRDFRGHLWQGATCVSGGEPADCPRRVHFSLRLPVEAFRAPLGQAGAPAWPPADLDRIRVHLQLLAPEPGGIVFDSNAGGAQATSALTDLRQTLRPGETVTLTREGATAPLRVLSGASDPGERTSPLILRLIDRLPVTTPGGRESATETITTPLGRFEVRLDGDARGLDPALGATATRLSWYVAAMLMAIVLAWGVVEVGLVRRIAELTRRAAAVSRSMQGEAGGAARIAPLDVSDLRGRDELGILAGGLADLLQRVREGVQREELRAQRERDMLQAVGHEILSPLQSLMVLHPDPADPAHRYVQRMQQAVRVLYGQASPSEALEAAQLAREPLDLDAFLREVAANAGFAGIADVRYTPAAAPVMVRADAFSLEDVVTHILRNADRHRTPGTPITLTLHTQEGQAQAAIHNQGPPIASDALERIFDYGVSDAAPQEAGPRRGQGLFVARTYMAKMGGSVAARNADGGVVLELTLPLG